MPQGSSYSCSEQEHKRRMAELELKFGDILEKAGYDIASDDGGLELNGRRLPDISGIRHESTDQQFSL